MTQLFTPEDVILHLYKEIPAEDRSLLDEALKEDYLLQEEYRALEKARRELPRVRFNASRNSLKAVLDYSRLQSR